MSFPKAVVYCPIGEHATLGYMTKGIVNSFVCKECGWIFSWDAKGKPLPPEKLVEKKPQTCDCGSCEYRDQHRYMNRHTF